jgi:recombination protein RecR
MDRYPIALEKLIDSLKGLQGVGRKSAERYAFDFLDWPENELQALARTLASLSKEIQRCCKCGCLCQADHCSFCQDPRRQQELLCVISSPKDAYAIEETHQYHGLYHVIGAPMSPMDGRGPDDLDLPSLFTRIQDLGVRELILALDSTLEGDSTALYISRELEAFPCQVTRLASGIPMGSSLQYVDGSTLAQAFLGRQYLKNQNSPSS